MSLADVPGISFPLLREGDRSTYKDFTVLVDETDFGCDAARLAEVLASEGIDTRRYYAPPVHTMRAYRHANRASGSLDATMVAAKRVLTLPLWIDMTDEIVVRVVEAVRRIQAWNEGAVPVRVRREIDLRDSSVGQESARLPGTRN